MRIFLYICQSESKISCNEWKARTSRLAELDLHPSFLTYSGSGYRDSVLAERVQPQSAWGRYSYGAESPVMSFVCNTNNTANENIEKVLYLLLNVVNVCTDMLALCEAISLLCFQKGQFWFLWRSCSFVPLTDLSAVCSLLTSHFQWRASLGTQSSRY